MRVKELKNFLNKMPDEAEIVLRCQNHETVRTGVREVTEILSVSQNIGQTDKYIIFNPKRAVRLSSFLPRDTEMVNCKSCIKRKRIEICKERGKMCADCAAVCECKNCGNLDIENDDTFSNKPNYERDSKFN